jgi:DNA-binding CsgD family transcriptional regulator
MNPHANLFFILLTIILGSAALARSGALRGAATPALLSRYRVFIGVFTLWLMGGYISIYAKTNMTDLPDAYFTLWLLFDGVADMAIVLAGFRVITELYALKRKRAMDLAAASASGIAFALILFDSARQGLDLRSLRLTAGIYAGLGFYYLVFLALIALGTAMLRRAPGTWGRSLAIGLLAMAITGMAEGLAPILASRLAGHVPTAPSNFLFTSIPWSAWCLFSVFILPRLAGSAKTRDREAHSLLARAELDEFSDRHAFSGREAEVLGLIAQGLTNAQIAERLCLSLSTVKSHVHSILAKSGSRGRFSLLGKIRSKG